MVGTRPSRRFFQDPENTSSPWARTWKVMTRVARVVLSRLASKTAAESDGALDTTSLVDRLSQGDPKTQALGAAVFRGLPKLLKKLAAVNRYYAPRGNVGNVGGQLDVLQSLIRSEEHTSELQSPC